MKSKIILICEVCLSRNYTKQKSNDSLKRLEIKKFCKTCNKHTVHKESK
ncbi:MAG: 50S ribosomal protein L33 [Erysipelotrichales bacterium]|nr:50S ribosomal protein L33 [Erysipelotrichales bacterium]